ncbi:hypothetical protein ACERC8_01525 [Streptococcus sp. E29BA]
MDDIIIGLADQILAQSETYGEALLLIRQVEREVRFRAYEHKVE